MTLSEKIQVLMKRRRTSAKRLSKEAGLNETYVRDILKGHTKNPRRDTLVKLAAALDCNLSTLLGEAPAQDDGPGHNGAATLYELDVRAAASAGLDVERDGKTVAFAWRVPAPLFQAQTSAPMTSLRIISIYGDSMEPTLAPGTRVVVDTSDTTPTPPGIFVVWDGLGLVAKRVEHIPHSDPPRVRLSADNPKYAQHELTLVEAQIQGRVIGHLRWM